MPKKKKRLDNAWWRVDNTPRGVMYRVSHGTTTITVDTQEELRHVLDYIRKQDADRPKVKRSPNISDLALAITGGAPIDTNPWTHKTFSDFIEAIGDSQKGALSLLVRAQKVSDAALRKAVGVDTNQQLAGVLSGLSKQAAAHNLPAREVFTIENESKSGEATKHYVIARHLLDTARANNWPLE